MRRVLASCSVAGVCGLYAAGVATFRMLDIVHDEKSPILQVPGSITYGCVMGGMALLAVLSLVHPPGAVGQTAEAPAPNAEPSVPQAHW